MDYFSEKIIVGPHEVPDPPSLAQMTFTQCTSMSELKFDSEAPPGGLWKRQNDFLPTCHKGQPGPFAQCDTV